MTTSFIQNDEVFTKAKSKFSQYSFFNDDLRARGRKPEKKETTNSAPN